MSSRRERPGNPGRLRRALPLAGVLLAGGLLYASSIGYGYTHYDDYALLVQERTYFVQPSNLVRTFGQDGFALIGPEVAGHFYRPVLLASFIADTLVGGGRPAFYHAVNVLIHLLATAALFGLLRTLGHAPGVSSLLSLLFCVHPALVPAVAWIPGRNDSLLGLFVVGCVYSLIRWLRGGGAAWLGAVWLGVALVVFNKESGLVLLGVLALVVVVEWPRDERPWPRLVLLAGGAAAITLAWLLIRRAALGGFPVGIGAARSNLAMLVVYVGKSLFPLQLSVFPHIRDVSLLPGFAALGALAGATWWMRDRLLGWAGIGLAWYGAFLLPTLMAAPVTGALEHRLYVSLLGLVIFAAAALERRGPAPRAALLAMAVLAGVFAVTSALRLPDYRDDRSFWRSAVARSPHATRAWQNLAYRALEENRNEEAEQAARAWLEQKPGHARAHVVIGASLGRRNRLPEAEVELRKAIDLDPDLPEAWQNLSVLQKIQGRRGEARESERRADEAIRRQAGG